MTSLQISLAVPALVLAGVVVLWVWWSDLEGWLQMLASPFVAAWRGWQLWRGRRADAEAARETDDLERMQRDEWDRKG